MKRAIIVDDPTLKERSIFYAAFALKDSEQRRQLLDAQCAGDLSLRQQVEELLAAHDDGSALRSPAADAADLVDNVESTRVGQTIGRYKLLEQIGEGGFGVVYMAEQTEPIQRRVALKVIKAGMDTKQVIGRFEAERQALALMNHPNIANVIDAGATDSGRPFFVMELVRGITVTEYCDQHGLSTAERLNLFMDICSAIQHAHQKGIIHRDIKPSNILVSDGGDHAVAKIIDFGIAKATQGRLTDKTLFTQFRQLMGTPAYMSPEQARMSAVDVDTRSDVYSLGVLLYELLTGATPFDSQKLLEAGYEEMCRCIREDEPIAPSTRISSLSLDEKNTVAKSRRAEPIELEHTVRGEMDWIVMKALEKNRVRRYETADALKLDVQRFLANEPVSAAAPTTAYQISKFVHRNRRAITAAGIMATLLVVGTVVSSWQAIRATRQFRRANIAERMATEDATRAAASEILARRNQYAAEMMVAQSSASGVSSENVYELLKKQIPKPGEPDFRGFEWRLLWNDYRRELFALAGHTDEIRSVAMSSDGRWLASGSTDGTARLWDVTARREVWSCSEGKHCNQVEFSPDDRHLFTRWWRGADILWDLSDPVSPKRLRDIESFGGFSPDGETAISDGATLKQWNLETGEVLHEYSDPAFDGTKFAGQSHKAGQWTTTFSADGHRLLTVGKDRTIKLWDTKDGSLKFRINSDSEVFDGALSPVDETIATVSIDAGTIQIWNGQGIELRLIQLDNPLDRVRFSKDGKKLVASERFGRIHVFDTQTWEESATFDSRGSTVALRLCSPIDPNIVVTASEISLTNIIRFWDISSRETVLDHAFPVRALKFSHDGKILAVGMANGMVQFWDVANRTPIFSTTETKPIDPNYRPKPALEIYKPGFVQFSPDDRNVAIIGPPKTIAIWDLDSQKPAVVIKAPNENESFDCLLFSTTGEALYAGTKSNEVGPPGVRVWNLKSPDQPVMTFEQPGKWGVASLARSHDGNFLASGRTDVKLWKPPNHQSIRTLDMTTLPISARGTLSLDFSPNGKWFAGGTRAGSVWLWNTSSWTHESLPLMSYAMSVDFSPDNRRLVASDMWNVTKMWDVESLQTVATFKGSMAEFSPDGTLLAVGCEAHLSSLELPASGRVRLYYAPPLAELP